MMYNEKIAAQVAAYFVYREGGTLKVLKLMKLMYLAERASLEQYGEPIMGDRLVSMQHGPALSITLDHINDSIESQEGGWNDWISDKADYCVSLKAEGNPIEDLLDLSEADLNILGSIYDKYGDMGHYEIRDFTHDNCGEWEDPGYTSVTIPYERLLKNVGYSPEVAMQISQRIKEQSGLDSQLSIAG